MTDIARGVTFSDTPGQTLHTATSENLFALVASAVMSDVSYEDFAAADPPVRTAASDNPYDVIGTQDDGKCWFDETFSLARTETVVGSIGRENLIPVLNGSADTLTLGAAVVQSSLMSGQTIIAGTVTVFLAGPAIGIVVDADIAPGATGFVASTGFHQVLVLGPVTIGDAIVTTTLPGFCGNKGAVTPIQFYDIVGMAPYNLAVGVSTLMTCLVYL